MAELPRFVGVLTGAGPTPDAWVNGLRSAGLGPWLGLQVPIRGDVRVGCPDPMAALESLREGGPIGAVLCERHGFNQLVRLDLQPRPRVVLLDPTASDRTLAESGYRGAVLGTVSWAAAIEAALPWPEPGRPLLWALDDRPVQFGLDGVWGDLHDRIEAEVPHAWLRSLLPAPDLRTDGDEVIRSLVDRVVRPLRASGASVVVVADNVFGDHGTLGETLLVALGGLLPGARRFLFSTHDKAVHPGLGVVADQKDARGRWVLRAEDVAKVSGALVDASGERRAPIGRARWVAGPLPGASEHLASVRSQIHRFANAPVVLVTGDSGTGKGEVARALHASGDRKDRRLHEVNCGRYKGATNADVARGELFGVFKGIFTGAEPSGGAFKGADGETLFLDEFGDLSLEVQALLLGAIEEGRIEPIGGEAETVDVRLILATNVRLAEAVRENRFREDLLNRIQTAHLELLPLDERPEDVVPLAEQFAERALSAAVRQTLRERRWPGNVRELESDVYKAVRAAGTGEIEPLHFGVGGAVRGASPSDGDGAVGHVLGLLWAPLRDRVSPLTLATSTPLRALSVVTEALRDLRAEGPAPSPAECAAARGLAGWDRWGFDPWWRRVVDRARSEFLGDAAEAPSDPSPWRWLLEALGGARPVEERVRDPDFLRALWQALRLEGPAPDFGWACYGALRGTGRHFQARAAEVSLAIRSIEDDECCWSDGSVAALKNWSLEGCPVPKNHRSNVHRFWAAVSAAGGGPE